MLRRFFPGLWPVLLASLLAGTLAGCAAGSKDIEIFEVPGWDHAVATRVSSGGWICFVKTPYDGGFSLSIVRASYGYTITIEKRGWLLEEAEEYPVDVSVDDLWRARLDGLAVGGNAIDVLLGLDADALYALRGGRVLTMAAATETFRFKLGDEAETLDFLEACYRRHLPADAAGYRNPFAAAQNPFKAPRRSEQVARRSAMTKPEELEDIFFAATGQQFRVEQATEFTPSADLVYFLDDHLFGMFWEESMQGRNPDTVFAVTLAGMQADCSGRAVSGHHAGRQSDLAVLRHGFVSCEEEDFFADVVLLYTDTYAMVFVTSSSLERAELAGEVGRAVGRSFVP